MNFEETVISDEEIPASKFSHIEHAGVDETAGVRIEELVGIWWGGVDSCYSDHRMNTELGAVLARWLAAQVEANPGAEILNSGYTIHHLRHVQKSPPFGRRKCSINGAIICFAVIAKKV